MNREGDIKMIKYNKTCHIRQLQINNTIQKTIKMVTSLLSQQSSTFLAPWTGFMEVKFSMDRVGGDDLAYNLDPMHEQMKLCSLAHHLHGLVPNRPWISSCL